MSRLAGKSVMVVADHWLDDAEHRCLALGDIVRLLPEIANLDAARLAWFSNSAVSTLVQEIDAFDEIILRDNFDTAVQDFEYIINLCVDRLPGRRDKVITLREIMGAETPTKETTFDLLSRFRNHLNIKKPANSAVIHSPPPRLPRVGFNYSVPDEWSIKRLPDEHWHKLESALSASFDVSWQPHDKGFDRYVDWIRSCDIILSVVGLGCHLATLFARPLVVLAGPTDYAESNSYPFGEVLYPSTPCPFRPCQLAEGVDSCGCMGDHDSRRIADAVNHVYDLHAPK